MLPVDLILGDDDLAWVYIASVGYGMTQDADGSDHLTHFVDTIHNVAGVTDQLLAPCDLWLANTVKGSKEWTPPKGKFKGILLLLLH